MPSIKGMYSKGLYGYQWHPKVPDPHTPGQHITPDPPGYWYYCDPHAMKRYTMMLLNTLKVHHISDIVTGDRLVMEQVVNRVGEGFNVSTAIVDTLQGLRAPQ